MESARAHSVPTNLFVSAKRNFLRGLKRKRGYVSLKRHRRRRQDVSAEGSRFR